MALDLGGAGMKYLIAALAALALCACGIADKRAANAQLDASLAGYKACLAVNTNNVMACEATRLTYQADLVNSTRPRGVISN